MTDQISYYSIDNLDQIELPDFDPAAIGWAIADSFPTPEYDAVRTGKTPGEMDAWRTGESWNDYVDQASYNTAPIIYRIDIDEGICDEEGSRNITRITLHARGQADIDSMQSAVEDMVACTINLLSVSKRDTVPVWFRLGVTLSLTREEISDLKDGKGIDFKAVFDRGIMAGGDTYPVDGDLGLSSDNAVNLSGYDLVIRQ